MTPVRRGGFARLADGVTITWSVADGRRGRRWRTATADPDGTLESVLLLELAPNGSLSKLELAGSHGLLSLHPEAGLLHGNVVSADGVRHLRFEWSSAHALVLERWPVPMVAVARSAVPTGVGERRALPAVVVTSNLEVAPGSLTLQCLGPNALAIERADDRRVLEFDDHQIPVELHGGGWPLEQE